LGASLSNDPECSLEDCKHPAEYAIYPDRFRRIELAVYLCTPHRDTANERVVGKQELYQVACQMIRESLGYS